MTRLSFVSIKPGEYALKKASYLTMKNGTATATRNFIQEAVEFNETSGNELVMIIRKLWLSKEIGNNTFNDKDQQEKDPFFTRFVNKV